MKVDVYFSMPSQRVIRSLEQVIEWRGISIPMIVLGFAHQGNGQGGLRSRSWNRDYLDTTFAYNDWVFKHQTLVSHAGKKKRDPLDAKGDDSPDILNYYGHFEVKPLPRVW